MAWGRGMGFVAGVLTLIILALVAVCLENPTADIFGVQAFKKAYLAERAMSEHDFHELHWTLKVGRFMLVAWQLNPYFVLLFYRKAGRRKSVAREFGIIVLAAVIGSVMFVGLGAALHYLSSLASRS